jgi:hypothetical protein
VQRFKFSGRLTRLCCTDWQTVMDISKKHNTSAKDCLASNMEKVLHFSQMSLITGTQGVRSYKTWIINTNHCEELNYVRLNVHNMVIFTICVMCPRKTFCYKFCICYKNTAQKHYFRNFNLQQYPQRHQITLQWTQDEINEMKWSFKNYTKSTDLTQQITGKITNKNLSTVV